MKYRLSSAACKETVLFFECLAIYRVISLTFFLKIRLSVPRQ